MTGSPDRLLDNVDSMDELFRRAAGSLKDAGWACEPRLSTDGGAYAPLHTASDVVNAWASSFSLLSSADETVWFLSGDDYSPEAEGAFAWNELEQLSIQAATTADEAAAVSLFWGRHLPILLSVRNGYEYLAVRDDGAVVHGTEPEFEAAVVVLSQFEDLLTYIIERPARRNRVLESLLFDATTDPR
jgi:hypothetical protein